MDYDKTQKIHALTKPEVQRLAQKASELQPFQDEKLDIYSRHFNNCFDGFSKARESRKQIQDEFDQRNQAILDRITELKVSTDREARQQLDRLKEFAAEFEISLDHQKQQWQNQLAEERGKAEHRGEACGSRCDELSSNIRKETDECRSNMLAKTGPIQEQLQQHQEFLAQQVRERKEEDASFRLALSEHFSQLRKKLFAEEAGRKKSCQATHAESAGRFQALDAGLREKVAAVKRHMQDEKTRVEHEQEVRAEAQERIAKHVMQFIHDFESNGNEIAARQEATRTFMTNIKNKLGRDSP